MIDPELLLKAIPKGKLVNSVVYLEEIHSTNEYAATLDNKDGVLVITGYQSNGKGRLGRKWDSERGKNLTFSIKKRFDIPYTQNQSVTFFFSYFLYSALSKFLKNNYPETKTEYLHVKWPNDIMFEDKKLCGLLIESKNNGKDYIIGIGVNVNQNEFANELNAVSLINITGKPMVLENILETILNEFEDNADLLSTGDYGRIFEIWKNSNQIIGRTCEFTEITGNRKRGIIKDLRPNGSIEIQAGTELKSYVSGEIRITGFAATKALDNPKIT